MNRQERRAAEGVMASFRKAFALGNKLSDDGNLPGAVAHYNCALALKPVSPEVYNDMGVALYKAQRLDEAVTCYRKALSQTRLPSIAHTNLAYALLKQGKLGEGWLYHECRPKPVGEALLLQWKGEPIEERTLLIYFEQGFGDTLQFCRYVPLAASRGAKIILAVPPPLVRLLGSLPGVDTIIGDDKTLPALDLHCSMMSLPFALGTNSVDEIPNSVPYLHVDPDMIELWGKRLSDMPDGHLRVGLVWAGDPRNTGPYVNKDNVEVDSRRSMAPELLLPLSHVSQVQFLSLQKTGPRAPANFPLIDFMDELDDFADTAALIANLDLVISVDTSVAHLAGAIGKPVWLLDRFDNCWRWLQGRTDSPWYPTLRIFRQPIPGDWASVIAAVKLELQNLASQPATPINESIGA